MDMNEENMDPGLKDALSIDPYNTKGLLPPKYERNMLRAFQTDIDDEFKMTPMSISKNTTNRGGRKRRTIRKRRLIKRRRSSRRSRSLRRR